jgi:hypothetical protein
MPKTPAFRLSSSVTEVISNNESSFDFNSSVKLFSDKPS